MYKKENRIIKDKSRQLHYNEEYNIVKRARTFDGLYHLPKWSIIEKYIDFSKPINCLEIGTHEGQSTTFFLNKYLKQNKNSKLLCCDPFYISHWNNLSINALCYKDILLENLKNDINNQVSLFTGTGKDLYKNEVFINTKKYDLIYIDDNHSYDNTVLNIKNCWDKLDIGGIIIFDDYNEEYATYDNEEAKRWCEPVRNAINDTIFNSDKIYDLLLDDYQLIIIRLL